ncbi:hypothetical protein ACUH78_18835 [Thauera sp. ZXT1-4]|uniref:hypothetical protein n=1 Tax=Thauera sp. ZXT1-4 TaxID=3460294 RepID=UPI004040A7C2
MGENRLYFLQSKHARQSRRIDGGRGAHARAKRAWLTSASPTLSIGDIPIGTAEKRPLHAAQLWERWGTSARRGLLPPLFDVQVLRITPRGLLLRGFQVSTKNGAGTAQHAQEWWAVPIDKPGAA